MNNDFQIKIALPKGALMKDTAKLAEKAGWQLSDYSANARLYHLVSASYPALSGKILHEKDIPIQVAMGNYDLGICGLDWIQELMVKYPGSNLVKMKNLAYGRRFLFLAASNFSSFSTIESIQASEKVIGIASEYPNLAESAALNYHFKRFNIFPVWGAAEIYPPENADLALLSREKEDSLLNVPEIARILDSTAFLIVNKVSLETKDLSEILNSLYLNLEDRPSQSFKSKPGLRTVIKPRSTGVSGNTLRLALPDGHQQKHMVNLLTKAGIKIKDYPSDTGNRRPEIGLPGVTVKVIRPQDMPLQVANGKFDVAVTGQDWVREHLCQFPSSPIVKLADLKYGLVKIVTAVHNDMPVKDIGGLRRLVREKEWRLRIASEYVRIADKYAGDNHLGRYRIIPTWGATEAFLPDDADVLIENTETGETLKRHNLKVIDILFESTACLIANAASLKSSKAGQIDSLTARLRKAAGD